MGYTAQYTELTVLLLLTASMDIQTHGQRFSWTVSSVMVWR